MHPIESKLQEFFKNRDIKKELLDTLGDEFSSRLNASIKEKFSEQDRKFTLRMSNIGLPLRQLCLRRDYGIRLDPKFNISGFYGTMLEHFMVFLLKSSGVNIEAQNKKVSLDVAGTQLKGELDLIIDGQVWDVKSASDYSYVHKFDTFKSLDESDSFGYMGQIFGYALAEKVPVGGWIVINKSKGDVKVVSVPQSVQGQYRNRFVNEFEYKIKWINDNKPAPACKGIIAETFYSKSTGNQILNRDCEWCAYHDKCHPNLIYKESVVSKAENKPIKYYTSLHEKYK